MAQAGSTVVNGVEIDQDGAGLETWRNATRGRVVINRVGPMGAKRSEMIGAGKTFHLSPQDRRLNQDMAANDDLDPFLNGQLQPIRLDEESPDFAKLSENPNLIGDDAQIRVLFRIPNDDFAERIAEIKNPAAIERLLELAQDDETNARVAQLNMLQARLAQLTPQVDTLRDPMEARGEDRPEIKPITPK